MTEKTPAERPPAPGTRPYSYPSSTAAEHLRFTVTFLLFVLTDTVILLSTIPMLALKLVSATVVAVSAAMLLLRQHKLLEGAMRAREEHARFLAAVECGMDDFYIFDAVRDENGRICDFRFAYLNPNAERRLRVKRNGLIGQSLIGVRPFVAASGLFEHYKQVVETGVAYTTEVFVDDDLIKATWIHVQVVKLGDGIAINSSDITESKQLSDHVNYLAHHDQLTGLPNRTLMHDRLDQAILRAQRSRKKVAVLMIDIDHFKNINDTLGHTSGDALLTAVAQRLRAAVRETDTVARMGGDEFVIIMPDFNTLEEVKICVRQLMKSVSQPFALGSMEINITVSIGICIYPDFALEPGELMKNADYAMYSVKRNGRNGLHLFSPGSQNPENPSAERIQNGGE